MTHGSGRRQRRPCQVCRDPDGTPLYANRMAPIAGLDLSYRVVRCTGCGLVYADELADDDTYRTYYRLASKYDCLVSAPVSPTDCRRHAASLQLIAGRLPSQATIVDIGCGSGALLHAFREAGWHDLHGLDPAPAAPTSARALFGLECIQSGSLDHAPELLPLGQADLVCLTGVLEHLPALRADLQELLPALKREARVLVEVPALERFDRRPCEPYGEFSLEHVQYFSARTLSLLMKSLGYGCEAWDIVALPEGTCDSLFGLFSRNIRGSLPPPPNPDPLPAYLQASAVALEQLLSRVVSVGDRQLVIYGAGSHSARLLPHLEQAGITSRIAGVVDANANLQGRTLGPFAIAPPAELCRWPDALVVISAFRGRNEIAADVRAGYPNPVLLLYS